MRGGACPACWLPFHGGICACGSRKIPNGEMPMRSSPSSGWAHPQILGLIPQLPQPFPAGAHQGSQRQSSAAASNRMHNSTAPEVCEVPMPLFAHHEAVHWGEDSEAPVPLVAHAYIWPQVEAWGSSSSSAVGQNTSLRAASLKSTVDLDVDHSSSITGQEPTTVREGQSRVHLDLERFRYMATPNVMEFGARREDDDPGVQRPSIHPPRDEIAARAGAEFSGDYTELHEHGLCSPCVFSFVGTCKKEDECLFCHLPHSAESFEQVPASRETRKAIRRRMNAPRSA